jgi:cytochrome P450
LSRNPLALALQADEEGRYRVLEGCAVDGRPQARRCGRKAPATTLIGASGCAATLFRLRKSERMELGMSEGRGTHVTDIFDYRAERDGKSPFHPPVKYQMLRDQSPVSQVNMWDGSKAWFITRRDDVRAALADERLSADNRRPGFPLLSRGSETLTDNNPTFARMDPPEHTRQRAMVNADFTQRPAARWRPQIQQIVDRLVDEMLAKSPPADLVGELAEPLAAQVMCLVLDIPYEEDFFQRVASTFADHYVGQDKLDVASDELTSFITGILEAKAANPGGDLLSRLITLQETSSP